MNILVTGSNGQLGSELREILKEHKEYTTFFVDRDELDVTSADAVDDFFSQHSIDCCINAAAYTNVEKAEDEKDTAHAVNVFAVENIARACLKNGTLFFHISTDFVFDGKKTIPYTEEDEPHPLGVYGMTKYEGELVVQKQCPKSFIVRTSWLYSSYGGNFVKTILRLCKERESLPVVADQYGSPTYARDLARALIHMVDVCQKMESADIPFGLYHYADDGEATWFEFAQRIVQYEGLSCALSPIPASEYPSKVLRPVYSVLSPAKIHRIFGVEVPQWEESLQACIKLL